jgi:hypothetical protein
MPHRLVIGREVDLEKGKPDEPDRPLSFNHEWLGFKNEHNPGCACQAADTPENAQSLNRN